MRKVEQGKQRMWNRGTKAIKTVTQRSGGKDTENQVENKKKKNRKRERSIEEKGYNCRGGKEKGGRGKMRKWKGGYLQKKV